MDGSESFSTFGASHPAPPTDEYVLNPGPYPAPLMKLPVDIKTYTQVPLVDAAEAGALQAIPAIWPPEPARVLH